MEQETNLYTITVPPMMNALQGLDGLLDKVSAAAQEKKLEWLPAEKHEEALLNDRLVFDQFPFVRQIQIACDNAKNGVSRIAAIEAPKMEDTEKTVAELKARIAKTLEYLKTIKPEQVIGKEGAQITLPYFPGKFFTGLDYATCYLMPNFYFHVVTAYSILRKNGITLGKTDFLVNLPFQEM